MINFIIKDEISFNMAIAQIRSYLITLKCSEVVIAKILTTTSELARNILKYAIQGKIFVNHIKKGLKEGIEIISIDKGPGIEDIEKALSDNYSSSGTLGMGLPGAKRMMDELKVTSAKGKGTTVKALLWF
jgi:serine/threonine-protein kinase RsbT